MTKEFSIQDLAVEAGVTVRTIRFYVNEGLLPSPVTKGRYAVYTESYLDRIALIIRLKDAFLPLQEIARQLDGLDDRQVKELLRRLKAESSSKTGESPAASPLQIREPSTSALRYVNDLMNAPVQKARNTQNTLQAVQRERLPTPAGAPPPLIPRDETWQRTRLTEGIELHIRQPISLSMRRKIQRLIEYSQTLFRLEE